jgi:hypothetical protein
MQIHMDFSYFSGTFALTQLTVLCGHQLSHSAANRKMSQSK